MARLLPKIPQKPVFQLSVVSLTYVAAWKPKAQRKVEDTQDFERWNSSHQGLLGLILQGRQALLHKVKLNGAQTTRVFAK